MTKKRISNFWLIVCMLSSPSWGQGMEHEISELTSFIQMLHHFSKNIPQEKVYLHFDNTSYYQGDQVWFKCYVVNAGQLQLSHLSKTLYVELLNPGGEIVDKRILKIENGLCHGNFTLNNLPFYSGFYEVRAYTKYMLNYGEETVFSRLLPVFSKPKTAGNFEEKEMLRYGRWGAGNYPMKRERPLSGKAVNIRFFPEGGSLVQGVPSRIAFEATDAVGNPLDVTGTVIDGEKQALCQFTALHEGKGLFSYQPTGGKRKDVAVIEYAGKKYQFDMPASLPQGVVMDVDNLSYPDSVGITLQKNDHTPAEIYGIAILHGGQLKDYLIAYFSDNTINFKIDKSRLPAGISQIVLFNRSGNILCDRLIFTQRHEKWMHIAVQTDKPVYKPFEKVEMSFSFSDMKADTEAPYKPATFSLSVRDGENEVSSQHNIQTDLLLMSEIKGYVRNPAYYFEENDETRQAALDLLLMVQGWRRYSWDKMAGIEPFELKHLPEQGIETSGRIVSMVKQKPQPNVDVKLVLYELALELSYTQDMKTDQQGNFSFVLDFNGKWNMLLTVSEKGKRKDHRILLNRVFSPEPKRYRYADLQISLTENNVQNEVDDEPSDENSEEDFDLFLTAYQDSISKSGIDEKIHFLQEVTVKAKKRTKEQDIYHSRSTSTAFYDVASEMDDIYDKGQYVGKDIHELMVNMNHDFTVKRYGSVEILKYQGKEILFVINYEKTKWDEMGYFAYKTIRLPAIKSIFINETPSVMAQYIECMTTNCNPMKIAWDLGCAVFIETYPDGQIPIDDPKGVRQTYLEGYSHQVCEFYSPDYATLPPAPDDYRRTIYWNPSVTPDASGVATIHFYNNSRCKNFNISAETITPQGKIGMLKR